MFDYMLFKLVAWGTMGYYLFWTPVGSKFYSLVVYPLYIFTCRSLGKKAVALCLKEFIRQYPFFWSDVITFFAFWPIAFYPGYCWDSFLSLWEMLMNLKTVPKTVVPDVPASLEDMKVPSEKEVPTYSKGKPFDKADKTAMVLFVVVGVIVAVGCAITGTGGTPL